MKSPFIRIPRSPEQQRVDRAVLLAIASCVLLAVLFRAATLRSRSYFIVGRGDSTVYFVTVRPGFFFSTFDDVSEREAKFMYSSEYEFADWFVKTDDRWIPIAWGDDRDPWDD